MVWKCAEAVKAGVGSINHSTGGGGILQELTSMLLGVGSSADRHEEAWMMAEGLGGTCCGPWRTPLLSGIELLLLSSGLPCCRSILIGVFTIDDDR